MRVKGARGLSGGWRFVSTLVCIVAMAASLSACLTVPTAQTDAMVAATNALASATDTIILQLNDAEKKLTIRRLKKPPNAFDPNDAFLYSTLDVYAPATKRLQDALGILKDYATLIQALVEGKTATDEANAIQTTIDNIASIGGAVPQFTVQLAAIDTAAKTFNPVIALALRVRTREEARILVDKGAEPVGKTIAALREATPAMFYLLTDIGSTHPIETPAAKDARFAKARVAVSDYVILLDRIQDAFDKLHDAYLNRGNAVTAVSLASATSELAADTKIVQQAFAALK